MADKILTWNNHPLLYNYKPIVYVRPPGFMSFQTEAYALPFDPAFSLSSGVLEWDLGDVSTNVEANSFSHTYNVSGNKSVNIYRGTTTGANDINAINMSSDDLVGTLDVSSLSNLNSYILVNNNYKLTQILNPTSSGIFTYYNAQDCNLTGVLDVSGLTGLGGNFSIHRNPNLTQILNPTSSEIFSWYSVYSCDLTGTLDISGLSRLGNRVYTYYNYNLTQILNPTSSELFSRYWTHYCNLTGTFDCSGLTGLGGVFAINNNPNLTQILNPTSNVIFSHYLACCCDLTGTLDVSGLTNLGGTFKVGENDKLTKILLPDISVNFIEINVIDSSLDLITVDDIFSKVDSWYIANEPTANISINTSGGTNSAPTDGSSNTNIVHILDIFDGSAGGAYTATITINYP